MLAIFSLSIYFFISVGYTKESYISIRLFVFTLLFWRCFVVFTFQHISTEQSLSQPTLFNLDAYTSYDDSRYIIGDIERVFYDPSWDEDIVLPVKKDEEKDDFSSSFPIHDAVLNNISIKVLTLHAPFALSLGSSKHFAIKGRKTNYRGKVAIHCASKVPSKKLLNEFSLSLDLPFSKIIGFAELTDCFLIDEVFLSQQPQSELQGGQWVLGKFAWKLENFTSISQMVSVSSKGSIWDLSSDFTYFDTQTSSILSFKPGDFVFNGRLGQVIDLSSNGFIRVQYSDCVESYDNLSSLLFLPTDLVLYFSCLFPSCQKTLSSSYTPSGSLVQYVQTKKLKTGLVATYPKVFSERDSNNVNHWFWGYYYQVKVDTKWKNRTLCVPSFLVEDVRLMIDMDLPVCSIVDFIRNSSKSY
ncbi:MAG: hypothetical protein O1I87_13810 [Cylindrospermopsis raciborskii PAMP2012]|uniref:hypothetical protein n=1 Tax=Cylindrospermopsis raciborskii TaxID=77022 RepID=UPI0022CA5677|nr:hypothetical protein [Cylindrospermopsis raciborskii]MCZ2203000.1 hypothetical protein [Cylindrospermopsis raciborskii PAMP2012]